LETSLDLGFLLAERLTIGQFHGRFHSEDYQSSVQDLIGCLARMAVAKHLLPSQLCRRPAEL